MEKTDINRKDGQLKMKEKKQTESLQIDNYSGTVLRSCDNCKLSARLYFLPHIIFYPWTMGYRTSQCINMEDARSGRDMFKNKDKENLKIKTQT